jgi:DNA-directed RNA polymerase subunit RPC12/RpoP
MEQNVKEKWICSQCNSEIADYTEYVDNDGVCDDCYSIPLKKRRGLVIR